MASTGSDGAMVEASSSSGVSGLFATSVGSTTAAGPGEVESRAVSLIIDAPGCSADSSTCEVATSTGAGTSSSSAGASVAAASSGCPSHLQPELNLRRLELVLQQPMMAAVPQLDRLRVQALLHLPKWAHG
eukprot:m.29848 g.29848  ORF g.29848 m.29848 type:complete len:131 (-) comp11979_c0_seq5:761-1153(-)